MKGQPEQELVHESIEPIEIWHRRLAHVHYISLPMARKAVSRLPEIYEKHEGICKGCAKERMQRRHFPAVRARLKEYWR